MGGVAQITYHYSESLEPIAGDRYLLEPQWESRRERRMIFNHRWLKQQYSVFDSGGATIVIVNLLYNIYVYATAWRQTAKVFLNYF